MHEVGLVEEAIRRAVTVMELAGASSIDGLTFALAPGGHVTPEAVETLFGALSAGTPAERARLEFELLEQQYGCWACGRTFTLSQAAAACPACGSAALKALPGSDLVLRYVDLPELQLEAQARQSRPLRTRGEGTCAVGRRAARFTSG
ncbi:MAG TPA: hydrogenase maturation nickel metallochaperone HypA [Chloroflexota bacterium]|nr:hydrogenase maturation nickel metallochaperone HypA [Chloroflexota bacterium]